MKREFLKGLELTDEVIDKIMAEHGKGIEKYKTAAETQKAELDGLKEQLAEANKTVESFKELDIEGIKKAADEWKAKAEKAEAESKAKIEAMQFEHALDGALTGAKAKNIKAVKALLDLDKIKFDDGKITGLDSQLEAIKAENGYLFDAVEDGGNKGGYTYKPAGGGDPPQTPKSLAEAVKMSLTSDKK
jgi:predicted  nucleic acid-binding Zn-ribbon protein